MTWVCNRPVQHSWCSSCVSDYEMVISAFIKRYQCDCVDAIYQIGDINVPGVSDIDFVVAFNSLPSNIANFTCANFSEAERLYITHDPIFITQDLVKKFGYLFPVSKMVCLWKRSSEVSFDLSQSDIATDWKLSQVLQLIFTKVPSSLVKRLMDVPVVNGRTLLNNIYSCRHTLALFDAIVKRRNAGWERLFDELNEFRRLSISLPLQEFVIKVDAWMEIAIRLLYEAIGDLEAAWTYFDGRELAHYRGDYMHYDSEGLDLLFLRNWDVSRALSLTQYFKENGFQIPTILPLYLGNYLCRVASVEESQISEAVKNRLLQSGVKLDRYKTPMDTFQCTIEQHLRLCECYFKMNKALNYIGQPYMQFGLSACELPLNYKVRRILRKVLIWRQSRSKKLISSSINKGLRLTGI